MSGGERARVRAARRQDIPRMVDLRVHYLGESAHLEPRLPMSADARQRTEQMLPVWMGQDERVILVAEGDAGEGAEAPLVGYVMGRMDTLPPVLARQHVGEILECFVEPAWRGRGLGQALVAVVSEAFVGRGAEVLRADVPVANETARVRLEAQGYRPLQWILDRRLDAV
jgi:ribosomal protein S18 acetylase RimI-like enzyme